MKLRTRSLLSIALITLVALGFGFALVQAQEEEAPELGYRQKLMKGHGASMGSIGDTLKYKLPGGAAHVAAHANVIAEYSALIPEAFKKDIASGKTDAKAEVWQNWDDFVAKANTLNVAATELAAAASGGDMRAMMPAVKALGESCRGCHNDYRKPEEERFAR
jgi:cytochrome c556